MQTLFIVISIIAAVLLICVILIQKSKGGGLASSFASSNQIMGVRRTNSFIEKLTWTLGGIVAACAILSSVWIVRASGSSDKMDLNKGVKTEQTTTTAGDNYNTDAAAQGQQGAPAATQNK